ncbi:MarR family winged helix-turn-helix transcriptional regulator [Panacagrimonas sp.]|uniref:MarR family winged helix-turn-helix transcriptional regulator n=1 Tax=Panacagrimonas sp. TaxID=2480088 RepID=UPI003B52C472
MSAAAARKAVGSGSAPKAAAPPASGSAKGVSVAAQEFLDLFYPVHYKIGIGIEDALRGGRLSRHQVAILWLIRSEGPGGRSLPRKDIERSMTQWFEMGSSAISKTLRGMAREPMGLIEIREHALSGREREVFLTRRGIDEIERMVAQGQKFIQAMVDLLSATEAAQGVHFLTRVSDIINIVKPQWRRARIAGASKKAAVRK